MKLSILIPTLRSREDSFLRLMKVLLPQINNLPIEVISYPDEPMTVGAKRNKLLNDAYGDYVSFIDDDDMIAPNYIKLLMEAIESGSDCASLKGEYSVNGVFDGIFEHSLKYKDWKTTTNQIKYERYPNHLNMIRASIAKQFKFPEINHGEDHDWSKQIHESGLLKTEFYIPEVLYYYLKVTK